MEFTRISESELTTIDPITGGTWRVTNTGPLSETAATLILGIEYLKERARPDKGVTYTIEVDIILKA
jgi:hypothetical protein